MAAWVFNNAETGGLLKLQPGNGNMNSKLASTGNALRTAVMPIEVRRAMVAPPGGGFSLYRTLGVSSRVITWDWHIAAVDLDSLFEVERRIQAYVIDGREYILSDGTRSTSFAVLDAASAPRGNHMKTNDGRWMRDWLLRFVVTRPLNTVGNF